MIRARPVVRPSIDAVRARAVFNGPVMALLSTGRARRVDALYALGYFVIGTLLHLVVPDVAVRLNEGSDPSTWLVLGGLAVAQTAERSHWDGPHRGWGPGHSSGHRFGPSPERVREHRAALAEDLGAELDESPERVEAAFRAVVVKRLDEAVAAGSIDRAQADDALAAYDEGNVKGLFRVMRDERHER